MANDTLVPAGIGGIWKQILEETMSTLAPDTRSLRDIARDIRDAWANPAPEAIPALRDMASIEDVSDRCPRGIKTGRDVAQDFLDHSKGWRGKRASVLKGELRDLCQPRAAG